MREITRLIDEQINSVRRELSNLLSVGVIVSSNADNKLYYEVNQQYEFYQPFRAIFAPDAGKASPQRKHVESTGDAEQPSWVGQLQKLSGVRVAIAAGVLVENSASSVDLLIAGKKSAKLLDLIATIERDEKRELNYTVMSYDEFYYRLSVRDRFITELLSNKHDVIVDTDTVLTSLS